MPSVHGQCCPLWGSLHFSPPTPPPPPRLHEQLFRLSPPLCVAPDRCTRLVPHRASRPSRSEFCTFHLDVRSPED